MENPSIAGDQHEKDRHVTVEVFAPRSDKPKKFTWAVKLKVGEAAREAATAFGYQGGDPTLGHKDVVFKRDETLAEAHVHDGEKLDLLDAGGGV